MPGPQKIKPISKPTILILAGGLGTRLREINPDLPKPMVEVNQKPFLFWLIKFLYGQGFRDFIFSAGYKSDSIEKYPWSHFWSDARFRIYSEKQPLGTGGAVVEILKNQFPDVKSTWVVNGDTILESKLPEIPAEFSALYTLLKPENVFDATPNVTTQGKYVTNAHEASNQGSAQGLDAGAIYLDRFVVEKNTLSPPFSIHTLLKPWIEKKQVGFCILEGTCYDIGTPARLKRFQEETDAS